MIHPVQYPVFENSKYYKNSQYHLMQRHKKLTGDHYGEAPSYHQSILEWVNIWSRRLYAS